MLRRRIWIGAILAVGIPTVALADDLDLKLGLLKKNTVGSMQVVSVKNNGARRLSIVELECGFYDAGDLVGAGIGMLQNLDPGATGHAEILGLNVAATRAECRIVSAE